MKINIAAGATVPLTLQGHQFYYESGSSQIKVRYSGDESREYYLYAGQGFKVAKGGRFNWLEITNLSGAPLEVEFDISDGEKFDNRAKIDTSGVMNVSVVQGAKPTTRSFPAVITLAAGVAQQILAQDVTRAKALLYFSAQTYLGSSNSVNAATGYPINAGSDVPDENTGALWAFSTVGGTVNIYTEGY